MANVYLYVHDLRSSGVVRNALTYARRLAEEHPTTLIAGCAEGLFQPGATDERFELVTLARTPGPLARLRAAARLRRWLARRPGGVLLSVGNLGHSAAYLGSRGLPGLRRVYRISNEVARSDGVRGRLRSAWMRRLCSDAARIILVGRALERFPAFAQALATGSAVAIPNGVDIARAGELAAAQSPHPWLDGEVPVVLTIGRLRPQKNIDLLIEAVGVARGTRRLRLIVVGAGSSAERDRLARLAKNHGLGEDFLLAGETDNVFAWLARADVFALASRWEGSSVALLEALAVGTPIVASRLAGDAASVLDDGRYGRLFDGLSASDLAAALLSQCGPDPLRPDGRANAYAEGAMADRYADLVRQVLGDG